MKIVTFNVNGVRARPHQLEKLRDLHDPDIIGLQEIKVHDDEFPRQMIEDLGYHVEHHGQKGHYGVALLSKKPPLKIIKGFPNDSEEAQKRMITGIYQTDKGNQITVLNGYFPQGENRKHPIKFPAKKQFYADLNQFLESQFSAKEPLLVIGDMNISSTDLDIGIGAANAKRWLSSGKTSFLPEEREWMETLLNWGLTDSFRQLHPTTDDIYSWFDYRSKGFDKSPKRGLRIDLLLATAPLMETLIDSQVDYTLRAMQKPSDHCPAWSTFDI